MMNKTSNPFLDLVAQAIYDKKGFNILALDVRGFSSLTDYVVIAEGNIDRHVKALALAIQDAAAEVGERPLFVEGEREGDWIVMDFCGVMVHLLVPDFREKYALEELWREAKIVDVKIAVEDKKRMG